MTVGGGGDGHCSDDEAVARHVEGAGGRLEGVVVSGGRGEVSSLSERRRNGRGVSYLEGESSGYLEASFYPKSGGGDVSWWKAKEGGASTPLFPHHPHHAFECPSPEDTRAALRDRQSPKLCPSPQRQRGANSQSIQTF
jgi:hypothetical protein